MIVRSSNIPPQLTLSSTVDAIALPMMDHIEDYGGIWRHPVKRMADSTHKDQLNFYGLQGCEEEFRKCYRFRKDIVQVLCNLLGMSLDKAFTVEQKLCIAL